MKIKKILISCTCLVLCLLVPVQTAHGEVLEAIGVINTVLKAYKYTIAIASSDNPFETAIYEVFHGEAVKGTVDGSIDNYLGASEVTLSSYSLLIGKYTVRFIDYYGQSREFMVTCSMYYSDGVSTNHAENGSYPQRYIRGGDGLYYITNNIYWSIYRDDGYYKRYRWTPTKSLTKTQYFGTYTSGYNQGIIGGGNVTIHRDSTGIYYDVTDGDLVGTLATDFTAAPQDVVFYFNENNSIVRNANGGAYDPSLTYRTAYHSIPQYSGSGIEYITYPTDSQICNGRLYYTTKSGNTSSGTYIGFYYNMSFFDTNDPQNDNVRSSLQSSTYKNTYNYFYDSSFKGGTVINNDNKTTILNGSLQNAFDVDGKVVALADVSAAIKPTLDLELDRLADLITDFYVDVPDYGLPWSGGGDNDYFDLTYEPPDSGGGGDGDITVIVTVDVPRPLVTTMTYTTPLPPVSLPSMTTYTLPAAVIEASDGIKSYYDVIFDETGLLPIFGFLALVGVGCAIIFKGV